MLAATLATGGAQAGWVAYQATDEPPLSTERVAADTLALAPNVAGPVSPPRPEARQPRSSSAARSARPFSGLAGTHADGSVGPGTAGVLGLGLLLAALALRRRIQRGASKKT